MIQLRQLFALDFPFLLIGNLLSSLAQWLLLLYLSREQGVAVMGQYIWGLSLLTPLFMFSALGFRNLIATDAHPQMKFQNYLGLRMLCLGLLLPPILAYSLLSDSDPYDFLLLIALLKSVESLSDLYYGQMQQSARTWLQGISMMFRFGGGILLFAIGSLLFDGVSGGLSVLLVGWLVVLLLFDRPQALVGNQPGWRLPIPDWDTLKQVLYSALPLSLSSSVGAFVINLPRYAIGHVEGEYALGQFAALTSFIMLLNMICIALGQSVLPALSRAFRQNNARTFSKILLSALLIILVITMVILALINGYGSGLLEVTFGVEIASNADHFLLISVLMVPLLPGQIMSYGNMAVKRFSQTLRISLVSAVVSLALCLPLVYAYGLVGAAALFTLMGVIQMIGFGLSMYSAFQNNSCEKHRMNKPSQSVFNSIDVQVKSS